MIGKNAWFTYRIGGWGIAARTWQGRVYILGTVALCVILAALPIPRTPKAILVGTVFGAFILDCLVIMTQLGRVHDERERLHQLIIERNCSFAAVFSLVGTGLYQTWRNWGDPSQFPPFDPFLVVILVIMALTKFTSTIFLRRKL